MYVLKYNKHRQVSNKQLQSIVYIAELFVVKSVVSTGLYFYHSQPRSIEPCRSARF